ncbi:MAG: hypothetical protein AAFP86_01875 [Planctomycetota bacterium]
MTRSSAAALALSCATLLAPSVAHAQCLVERIESPLTLGCAEFGASMDSAVRLAPDGVTVTDRIVVASASWPTARAFVWRGVRPAGAADVVWDPPQILDTGILAGFPCAETVTVATDGTTVAVGVRRGTVLQRVHLFTDGADGWAHVGTLTPPPGSGAARFGDRLDVFGRSVIVGSPAAIIAGEERAEGVFLFEQLGGEWTFVRRFEPIQSPILGPGRLDVGIDENVLAYTGGGGVRIFTRVAGNWRNRRDVFTFVSGIEVARDAVLINSYWIDQVSLEPSSGVAVYRGAGTFDFHEVVVTSPLTFEEPLDISYSGGNLVALLDGGEVRSYAPNELGLLERTPYSVDTRMAGAGTSATNLVLAHDSLWTGHPSAPFEEPDIEEEARGIVARYAFARSLDEHPLVGPACDGPAGSPSLALLAGCPTYIENDLFLEGSGLPPNEFVLLLAGDMQGGPIPVLGGAAQLCIGGAIGRGEPQLATSTGRAFFPFDVESVPSPGGIGPAARGSTLGLQLFARDLGSPLGGAVSNGLRVQIE